MKWPTGAPRADGARQRTVLLPALVGAAAAIAAQLVGLDVQCARELGQLLGLFV